jgi:hypothetical protein
VIVKKMGCEGTTMIKKYLKYAMLLEAEVISLAAQKVQEITEQFVRKNADNEYEESLSNFFDGIEKTIKDFSPQIEKVTDSVNKIKDNILDFPKRKAN